MILFNIALAILVALHLPIYVATVTGDCINREIQYRGLLCFFCVVAFAAALAGYNVV